MRNELIQYIENTLSDYLNEFGEEKYLEFVNSNALLKEYVEISSKIDNNYYPSDYLSSISDDNLQEIVDYLKDMINWSCLFIWINNFTNHYDVVGLFIKY